MTTVLGDFLPDGQVFSSEQSCPEVAVQLRHTEYLKPPIEGHLVVRQVFGASSDIVGRGSLGKLNSLNLGIASPDRFADTMHAIHQSTIRIQYNREGEIGLFNQREVFEYRTARRKLPLECIPMILINFINATQVNALDLQPFAQLNQSTHIPSQ